METLTDIPFSVDTDSLRAQAHVDAGSDDDAELQSLADLAQRNGRPKAAYAASFVDSRDGDVMRIGGIAFASRTLARNLESVERVFAMVATCGHEMDQVVEAQGDLLRGFWWDLIKGQLLGTANRHLSDHLHRKFRLGKTAVMRPGSGDAAVWPIEQQRGLFSLLGDVEGAIGVRLTDSFLMVPNKTTSGILFPTETDFRSCEVCHRESCPSRHAPFNKALWEAIQHD
jgi:hypothetical protein